MVRQIKIFDTTLRDGEQSPGCSMNLSEKLQLARQLDALGVDVIEAGFAISSPEDFRSVQEVAAVVKNAAVASLARATKGDIDSAWQAVQGAVKPRIHVFLATSAIHMEYKLKMTPQQVVQRAADMVAYAKTLCPDIEFSAEDACRTDLPFLAQVCTAVIEAGVGTINIPDTVGYTTPQEMFERIDYLKKNVPNIDSITLATHCHNDLGMAVANSLAAVQAGVDQIECTVNGIGERAGNTSLEEVVMALITRKHFYNVECGINTRQIYRTSKLLSTITGVQVQPNKAIVGANAFAHEAGIHQHGMLNNPSTYEIMTPESVGVIKTNLVLGKHSGKHALKDRLIELGYEVSDAELDTVFTNFKIVADKKKDISDKDIEALLDSTAVTAAEVYTLADFVVNSGTQIPGTAMIKLHHGTEIEETVAAGSGPIDASFKAIEAIAQTQAALDNYTIHSVTEGEDALGEVIVKLSRNGQQVTGRGLSTDIIEASIKAYINGVNKILAQK